MRFRVYRSLPILVFLLLGFALHASEHAVVSSNNLTGIIQQALVRSPELIRLRLEVRQAMLREPLLLSETDPQFQAEYGYVDDQSPRTAPLFEGTRSRTETMDLNLIQRTLIGTEARLAWENTRVKNPSQIRVLDPSAESSLSLRLRQPLLRYFWGRPDAARRRGFRSNVEAQQMRLKARETEGGAVAARAYLELWFAVQRIRIGREAIGQAKRLLSKHTEKRRYGLVEDSDLLQAQASLEIEETELALAETEAERARNALVTLLSLQSADQLPPVIEASTSAVSVPAFGLSLSSTVRLGLEQRGDVRSSRAALESARAALRVEKLDNLPDLAVSGSYGYNGLNRSYSGAWNDLEGFDHPVKSIGVDFTTPLGYRKERLENRSREIALAQAESDFKSAEQQAIREIKDAWENLKLRESRLSARRRLLELQRKKLKAEEVNFDRGRSSTDLLVRFQQDIIRTELDASRSEADYLLAQIELYRATGTLLTALGVETPHD